jgi:hypothetical protein
MPVQMKADEEKPADKDDQICAALRDEKCMK